MSIRRPRPLRPWLLSFLAVALVSGTTRALAQDEDPAEVSIGERLFLETRFAEFFAANATDVNQPLASGDPTLAATTTRGGSLPGPFAGESMNCRACHLVDEQLGQAGGGMRTYADFARRSPIPARSDGRTTAPRNSPSLVNASLARRGGVILHLDGEFGSIEDLVRATLTGRNYGWLPNEGVAAIAHIARVIRDDDGTGALAQQFGGAYRDVLLGDDVVVPAELVLPAAYRIDVDRATDRELLDAVAALIAAYLDQLVFSEDEAGFFDGSPYDAFLRVNRLPRAPRRKETARAYTARLRKAVRQLRRPVYVNDGPFAFHDRDRRFGPLELRGLEIFLASAPKRLRSKQLERGGIGQCASCHLAPAFTDFGFHNTGVSQRAYDAIHGEGRFGELAFPSLEARNADPNAWLPASPAHPHAQEPFRAPADVADPNRTDLGVWNMVGNPDRPDLQPRLLAVLCRQAIERKDRSVLASAHGSEYPGLPCRTAALLESAVGRFKTPGLRDLSHSAPYMHDGALDTLEDVIGFYRVAGEQARAGTLRNGAPELRGIALLDPDVAALAAFLRSLDEDYD
ncbi:MAG: cytochrome c peroxidase [Myxococcota bacterium]